MRYILPHHQVTEVVGYWLRENNPKFDVTAVALSCDKKEGVITISNQCVLAGSPFIDEILSQQRCTIDWKVEEGTKISSVPCVVATVRGPTSQIFQCERLILSILSRACGIATYARKLTDIGVSRKWKGSFVGSRKTTPGFSLVEKYAMIVGGACPHGVDMTSLVLLKDNHIDSVNVTDKEKAISQAVTQIRKIAGHHMKIEVESKNEKEAISCALAGADIVLLHQFAAKAACSVAQRLKSRFPRIVVEASGTMNENNINEYMVSGIDILSTDKMASGYSVTDVSLKLQDYTDESITEKDTPLKAGIKRPIPQASGGKTIDSANVNKNGDSDVAEDVDADVPDKRRKMSDGKADVQTDSKKTPTSTPVRLSDGKTDVQADLKKNSTAPTPVTKTTTPATAIKSSPSNAAKPTNASSSSPANPGIKQSSSSVSKISPATSTKAPQQTPSTSGKQNSRSNIQKSNPEPRGNAEKSNTVSSFGTNRSLGNQSSSAALKRDPPRTYGGSNQTSNNRGNNFSQSGQNRGEQRFNQYNRNRGQDDRNNQNDRGFQSSSGIQRPQPPQPTGRGIVGSFGGNSGIYQQQMALQAAVSRTTGVSLRPGNNTMSNRHDMNNRGMNVGRSMSGFNSMSNDANRGFNSNRQFGNVDWQYGY